MPSVRKLCVCFLRCLSACHATFPKAARLSMVSSCLEVYVLPQSPRLLIICWKERNTKLTRLPSSEYIEQTTVATNPYAAAMSPANFEMPHEFRPSRWLSAHPYDDLDASRPFSFGPRACLGRGSVMPHVPPTQANLLMRDVCRLAWLELHVTVAKMLYTYDVELVDASLDWNQEARMSLLWKKPKLLVRLKKRQHSASTSK